MPPLEPRLVVIGSANMDLVLTTGRFPAPGETVMGSGFATYPGGKGANQAVAAARMGVPVSFIGKVGRDAFGEELLFSLSACGVDVTRVGREQASTGVAGITVDATGQNTIVVAPCANALLSADYVRDALSELSFTALLCQLEVPLESILAALEVARERGALTLLNPAPAMTLPEELLERVDYLTPNEAELALLQSEGDVSIVPNLVVTLGERGALHVGRSGESVLYPGVVVDAVDTTAAGDAFNGALAACLVRQMPIGDAIPLANRAAALSVTRRGAQPSMPRWDEL